MSASYLTPADTRRIKAAIIISGFSCKSLGQKIGVTNRTMSNKLQGHTDFTRSEMLAISRVLGVPILDLFFPEIHD